MVPKQFIRFRPDEFNLHVHCFVLWLTNDLLQSDRPSFRPYNYPVNDVNCFGEFRFNRSNRLLVAQHFEPGSDFKFDFYRGDNGDSALHVPVVQQSAKRINIRDS